MLEELGHQILIGDAAEIRRLARRRQKNDRRDANLILDLLVKGEFPRVHRLTPESLEVMRQIRYRHKLVKMRTIVKNSLHALSIGAGLSLKRQLFTRKARTKFEAMRLTPVLNEQRDRWLELMDTLNQKIESAEKWLKDQAVGDERVGLLQTHPGIGLLSALALVHSLEPVARFSTSRKVVAYIGLDPMEKSSAEKIRYGAVSKAGSKLLRFLLGEAGQAAARKDPELRIFYSRLTKRSLRQKAKVAVARKLAVRSYIMLRDRIDYEEFLRRGILARSSRGTHRRDA
jgi:transposase